MEYCSGFLYLTRQSHMIYKQVFPLKYALICILLPMIDFLQDLLTKEYLKWIISYYKTNLSNLMTYSN